MTLHRLAANLHHQFDDVIVFLVAERRRLARRSARDETVDARRDLLLDNLAQPRLVDFPVPGERRDQCCVCAGKHRRGIIRPVGAFSSAKRRAQRPRDVFTSRPRISARALLAAAKSGLRVNAC